MAAPEPVSVKDKMAFLCPISFTQISKKKAKLNHKKKKKILWLFTLA